MNDVDREDHIFKWLINFLVFDKGLSGCYLYELGRHWTYASLD